MPDKNREIKQFTIDLQNASQKASKIITDETANYVKENHKYNNLVDYAKAHIKSHYEYEAEFLAELGYAKASDVAEVRHGRWKEVREFVFNLQMPVLMGYECSECGTFVECGLYRDKIFHKNYCGNCGAKMDGERSENGK